ncbi:hypothetical protein ZOSMA_216G00300 [Zostera marina]|uniref:Uncharacterized protein n=1 Tax=Zostera marina TaxID=29655 RepID=A0A0K9PK71_ZOSMR|nr:hypothetical protein ZOSMA_216G00300 [Zostera marina]
MMFSPIMVAVGKSDGVFWSFGVFGLIIGFSRLPVIFSPETRGTPICDTMEQQEATLEIIIKQMKAKYEQSDQRGKSKWRGD